MKDFIESIRLQIYERLSSPLFGALLVAWCGWNYRFVTVLFSNLPIKERFEFIDQQLYSTPLDRFGKGLAFPVITAVLFILVYPYPARWLFGYWHRRQRELKEIRDKIEGDTLLTVEESRKIRMTLLRNQVEYDETIKRLIEERDVTKAAKSKDPVLQPKETKELGNLPKVSEPEIEDGTLRVIGILAKNGGKMREYEVFDSIKEPQVKMSFYVDEGMRLGFIKRDLADTHRMHFDLSLTEKGRQFAVRAKYV